MQALEQADQAKDAATESSMKVSDALNSVDSILRQLSEFAGCYWDRFLNISFPDNLDSIDTNQLDALEQHLEQAEQQLLNANIEQRYTDLMASRQQQSIWVHDYTDELIQLRKDVENIRVINETIPRQCFKEVELEPELPSTAGWSA